MVIGLQPLFIALLVRVFFRERLRNSTWLSFILAITGIILLAQSRGASTPNMHGIVFALLCAILLGFNFTYHLKFLSNESPFRLVFFQNILQLPVLFIVLPFIDSTLVMHDVMPFAHLGILSTGIAYYLIYAGSKTVKKQLIGFFQLIENIIPVLTGVFLMQEELGWSSVLGIALVLSAGIWCMKSNAA
jgi:DME family drug/metabolite transporter